VTVEEHVDDVRMDPAAHLDELNELRVQKQTDEVVDLATRIWRSWEGADEPAPGIGAACQVAFIALMDVGRTAQAQVWRNRAMIEGARAGEPNTVAMLAVPIAFATTEAGDAPEITAVDAALEVMSEVGRTVGRLVDEGWSGPGLQPPVLWRAYYEKSAYLHWRAARYDEALSWYQRARPYVRADTRDALRLDAGELLCRLGIDQQAGTLDLDAARAEFEDLFRQADGRWDDIAEVFEANAERLAQGLRGVQGLLPVEVERRAPGGLRQAGPRGRTEVLTTIYRRRTSREDYEDTPVDDVDLRDVLRAGCAAPSSKNAQPWRLHVVDDRDLLRAIADAASSAEGADSYVPRNPATGLARDDWPSTVAESAEVLRHVPVGIFVENKGAFSDGRSTLAAASREGLTGSLVGYTFEILGIGAAIENMVLAAQSLGLQTAFMGDLVIAEPFIRDRLGFDGDLVGVLVLGYSSEPVAPRGHLIDIDDERRVVRHR
jgi:nitroreductase